ncbi:tol-pal system-associated acyl-CoA thioesterase [Collimonas humicola]|uniref:tol-pal system-associated acyl-CoA thioesterase n=1 Tax=Collimonas humicola TaxID=2825886 RepID=UPI001B8A9FA8|nr:tol-pal system-associated acyl-CoA thioesterase [Collimonas humicola]
MSLPLSDPHTDFSWRIRVYYEDTDAGGVVFYANYLKFFERARTEWLRAAGIGQHALEQSDGAIFIVKSTSIDYHAPAKLDDELQLTVVVERLGRAGVDFVQQAWRIGDGEPVLMCTGRITVVCVGTDTFRPRGIPRQVLENIKAAVKA